MKIHTCEQYSDEWWKFRRGIPTASEFPNIITGKTHELAAGHNTYINRLIGDTYDPNYGQHDDYKSEAMKAGTLGEPEARRFYAFDREVVVQQVGFVTTDDGYFGCSPDSLVGDDGGLELKCPMPHTHVGYLRAGTLPDEYKAQVHGCLWITGRTWWDFMSFCNGFPPLIIRVTPDEYTVKLSKVLAQFRVNLDAARKLIADMQPAKPEAVITSDVDEEILF
jgi:hypothetical protein